MLKFVFCKITWLFPARPWWGPIWFLFTGRNIPGADPALMPCYKPVMTWLQTCAYEDATCCAGAVVLCVTVVGESRSGRTTAGDSPRQSRVLLGCSGHEGRGGIQTVATHTGSQDWSGSWTSWDWTSALFWERKLKQEEGEGREERRDPSAVSGDINTLHVDAGF